MTQLYFYDDARGRSFEPFASTRPLAEMRTGAALLRERWLLAIPATSAQVVAGNRLANFEEPDAAAPAQSMRAGSIVVNARCAPALLFDAARRGRRGTSASVWVCGGRVAAVRVGDDLDIRQFEDGSLALDSLTAATGDVEELTGWWHDNVWDYVRLLPEILADDAARLASGREPRSEPQAHVARIGGEPVALLGEGDQCPTIEPNVVLDSSNGPIVIDQGAVVHAFTRLNGPCYIGPESTVMGGEIGSCAIGQVCKVRGEMSNTVMLGYANKGHDGFIGHSYLGRWVNIGASTVTSNLKNTYGTVSLWTPEGLRDTGMQFLGTLFGDHVKTGIGLRLTTGTVLGAGANVYDRMPPKVVAPFSWGDGPPYSVYRIDKFIETAERMMARRHMSLSERARRHFGTVHSSRWSVDGGPSE
jgi:UDP-N-acetylglucosamine diphosphorylase/glucosamine-1-phosphate N-acetyltransferase